MEINYAKHLYAHGCVSDTIQSYFYNFMEHSIYIFIKFLFIILDNISKL